MKPSDQETATHDVCGHFPYRDWCRACVEGTRRSDAHKRRHEEPKSLLVASMDYGYCTDGDDGEHSRRGTLFLNLSSDDMRVECLLERLERERFANRTTLC